jgi:raffinose/stachyose/melibiose transport system substrate-binding protein
MKEKTMNKEYKHLAVALALSLFFVMLISCAPIAPAQPAQEAAEEPAAEEPAEASEEMAEEPAAEESEEMAEEVALEMWHFAANKDPVYNEEWIPGYAEVEPNVTITTNLIPKDAYNQTVAAALIAGEAPALIHGLPLGEPLEFWNNDQIVDLGPHIDDEWLDALYPSSIDYLTIDDKVLSMSFATNNVQVFYNKDRFEELGIETPIETMDDMRAAVELLRENGYGGALYWAQANDHAPTPFFNWGQQMYPDEFEAADRGDGRWDSPEFVALMEEIDSYSDIWMDGIASLSLNESVNLFASGDASIYIIGNWAINAIVDSEPEFEIDTFPVPALNDQTEPAAFGSMAGTWMVSSQVPEAEQQAAIDFLRWVTLNQQGGLVRAIGLCPAGEAGEEALTDAKYLAQTLCDNQATAVPRDIFDRAARDSMAAVIQGMLNDQASPEEVMAAAQEAKEKAQ